MPTRYLRAIIAVLFVSGIAGATFFVSSRLSTSNSVAPNAPDSNPQAAAKAQLSKEDREELATSKAQQNNKPVQTQSTPKPRDERDDDPPAQTNNSQAGSVTVAPGSTAQAQNLTAPTATPFQTPNGGTGNSNQTTNGTSTIAPGSATQANSAQYNQPSNAPANTPAPTIAENKFGYRPPSTANVPAYMKPENNKCDDGLGFVAGTGCYTNPSTGEVTRKLINDPNTHAAAAAAVKDAREKIVNKSDQELLQIAAQNGKTCGNSDFACQQRTIQQITEKLLIDNAVVITKDIEEIRNAREKNQLVQDAVGLSDKAFFDKYNNDRKTMLTIKEIDNGSSLAAAGSLLATYKDPNTSIYSLITAVCKGSLNPECRNDMSGLSREQILKNNIGNSVSADYLTQTINQYKDTEKANKYISLFLDQNKSDKQKIDEYCKDFSINQSTCLKNMEINDLAAYAADPKALVGLKKDYTTQSIISDPKNDINDLAKLYCGGKTAGCTPEKILGQIKDEGAKQQASDQLLFKIYTDINNSPSDLAKLYCAKDEQRCFDNFQPETFINKIKDPNVKQFALSNRNSLLFEYIVPIKTNQKVDIDNDTKKEVEKFDADFQHAYWAYWKQQTQDKKITCQTKDGKTVCTGNISQTELNNKLGEDFYKLFAANPSEFNKYLSEYNANPKSFTDIQTATAFKAATDINSSIIALNNQAIKSSPIKGLYEDNKIVTWNKASEEYKQEARKLACENDKSIAVYCTYVLSDSYASVSRTKEQRDKALAQIDAAIANTNKQTVYLQEVYNDKITNSLPSSFYSNTASIDNYTIPQEIRTKAIEYAQNNLYDNFDPLKDNNSQYIYQESNRLANQYLDQKLVTETYTRGGGVAGSLAAAGLATTACAALGPPGLAISIGCGAAAGLVGAISTYIPILGTVTAEEMATEQQALKDFKIGDIFDNAAGQALIQSSNTLNNLGGFTISPDWQGFVEEYGNYQPLNSDSTSGIVQSLYSSQGAYCETADGYSIGGSCTRKDNQYANYQSMLNTYGQYGANLSSLNDQNFVSQLAIQGTVNQQFDALQRENQKQAIANIIVAPIIGAASGGIGGRLAQSSAPLNNPSYVQALLRQQANDWILWAPGSAIGVAQNAAQFNATAGFIDTEAEIKLEICIREKGASECKVQQQTVDNETAEARRTTLIQGFLTDTALQVGQSGFSFATEYVKLAAQNSGQTPPPANIDTATNNLISSSAAPENTTPQSNTTPPPSSVLSTSIKNVLNEITSDANVIRDQPNTTIAEVKANSVIDNAEKTILTTILEANKPSSQEFFKNPNSENFNKFINDINNTAETLTPQFGGDVDAAKAGIIEILQIIETRENLSGRYPVEIENLVNATKVQTGTYRPTSASVPEYTAASRIDPFTEATERLIDFRSRRNHDLTLDEVNILLEGIELTDKRISDLHDLQKNPNFQDAVKQVSSALSQADAAKKTISNTDAATLFELTSERIVFDKTAELAKKLSPSYTAQQTAAVPQPNTPPPPVPPAKPKRANTAFVDGDNSYLLTLAKDLGVSTANKTDDQIRTEVKQEMNKRVFGNKNGPTDPTDNTEIRGYIFRDNEGNVLSKDMYWRPESFGDPFVFTREQADAIFANSNNWQFKPDRTLEVIYDPASKTTKLASGTPFTAKIKEIDIDGNVKYTVDKIDGVVFVADKNSPEAKAAKGQDPNSLTGKRVADLPIENATKSPIEVLSDNSNLPNNLKTEIQNEYGPNQINKLNTKLGDPNYRPTDNPLVRVFDILELTPEAKLLNAAKLLKQVDGTPYDLNRPLSEIVADVRTADSRIVKRKNNLSALTAEERKIAALGIPKRIAEKIIEIYRLDPTLKISEIDIDGVRFWSGNYLDGNPVWTKFQADTQERITSGAITEEQAKGIINAAREHLTDNIKSSILKNNPDFILSPKNGYQDTFIDLNADRIGSLENMKNFLKPGGDFERDVNLAIAELNKTLKSGGKIKRFQIDKTWNLNTLEVANLKPGDILLLGLSQDPTLPTKFHFIDNEIYSSVQGSNGEILNAVFAGNLKEKISNIDSQLPIIEQASRDTPGSGKYHYDTKNIDIYGVAVDPETIKNIPPKPSGTNEKFSSLANYSVEEINYLANINHETGTSAEGIIASLGNQERGVVTNQKLIDMEMNGTADLIIGHTTQVAGDLAGFSTSVDVLTGYTKSAQGISEATTIFEGWNVILSTLQSDMTVKIRDIGSFNAHEHAGDGVRALSLQVVDLDTVSKLIEISSLYKEIITKATNGEYGTSAQRTAEVLLGELKDNVFLKIGMGTGNTVVTFHSGDNSLSTEFKSTVNIDEYLDNVKKYINQEKAAGNTPPEKIIGVNKDFYDKYSDIDLAKKGLIKIETDIKTEINGKVEIKKAYLIAKISEATNTPPAPPTPPTPPRKNNSVKKSIIEIIESITIAPKKTETKTNPVKQTYANLSTEKTTIAEFSKPVFDPKLEVQTILKETGQPRKIALSNFKKLFGDQQRGLAQTQAKIAELLTVNSNVQTEQIRKMFNDNTQNLKLADWQKEEFETWLSKVDQKRKAMENIEKKYTKEQVFKIVFGDNMVYDQTQITIEYHKPTGIVFTMSSDYYTRVTGKSETNYGVQSFARIDGQSITTVMVRESTPNYTKLSKVHEIQHALYYLSDDIGSFLNLSDFDTSNKNLITELAKYNFSKKTREALEKVLSNISRSISDRRKYAYIRMTDEMIARIKTGKILSDSEAVSQLTSKTYNFYKKGQDDILSLFPLNDANERFIEIKTSLAEYIRKDADANILADNLLDAYINARYNNVDNDTVMAVIDDIEDNITPKVQQKELATFVEAYQNLFNETRGYSGIRRQLVAQIEGGFNNSYNANIRRVVEDFYLNDAEQIHAIKTAYKNYTDLIASGLTSDEALAVLRAERTTKAARNIRYIIGDRDLIFQINNLLQKVSLKKAKALTENIIDTMPKPIKITIKISAFTMPITIPTAFWVGMNWNDIFNNQQTIPAPTPTAIYASPTPTITASPTPTITIQPTITISPTPTLFTPSTNVPVSYTLPKSQSLSSSQMREFSLTAKAVGQMIINCQNEGIYKDGPMVECICKQTTNNCADGSIEKTIAEDIAQLAGGTRPLECIGFMFSIERTRPAPIATGCQASFGNDMVPDKCAGAGSIGAYFCPQSVVEKNGFVEGDIIVTQDNREGEPGHAEVCTELTNGGCTAIGANYDKNGLVAFRKVDSNSNFAGVWRGGSNIEGCTEY